MLGSSKTVREIGKANRSCLIRYLINRAMLDCSSKPSLRSIDMPPRSTVRDVEERLICKITNACSGRTLASRPGGRLAEYLRRGVGFAARQQQRQRAPALSPG